MKRLNDSSKTNTEISMSNLSNSWVGIHPKEMKIRPQVLLSDMKRLLPFIWGI